MSVIKSLLLLLLTITTCAVHGQLKNSKRFTRMNSGFCDEAILLDSLGFFFKEKGCEGNSTISFGRYVIDKGNIVRFDFLPFDSLPPIKSIKRYKDANDSIITITLFDRDEKPLVYISTLEAVDTAGKQERVSADESGKVVLNRKLYNDLLITSLLWIYGQQPELVTGEENNIEVHLSLPSLFLVYNEVTVEKPGNFKLILKKDGLYKLDNKTRLYPVAGRY